VRAPPTISRLPLPDKSHVISHLNDHDPATAVVPNISLKLLRLLTFKVINPLPVQNPPPDFGSVLPAQEGDDVFDLLWCLWWEVGGDASMMRRVVGRKVGGDVDEGEVRG
jgi:hypothetical protein